MDTSKIYIKMCERAEIQGGFKDGDYYADENGVVGIYCEECEISEALGGMRELILLPRQDRLQEIVIPSINSNMISYWMYAAYNFHQSNKDLQSMEQLWLAFIMHELYHKTWNGNDWLLSQT